jgi:hypothetical protein
MMSDRRRAALGGLLLVMPILFLAAVGLRDGLAISGLFDAMQAELLGPGRDLARPLTAALIVLGPPLALLVNLLAVVGVASRRLTFAWKPVNAALAAGGFAVTGALLVYPLLERLPRLLH